MAHNHPDHDIVKAKLAQIPPDDRENGVQFYINLLNDNPDMKPIFEGKVDKAGFEKAGYDFLMCMNDLADKIRDEGQFNDIVAHLTTELRHKGVTVAHLESAPKAFYKLLKDKTGGLSEEEEKAFNEFFKRFMEAARAAH